MSNILNLLEDRLAKGQKTITIREIAEILAEYSEKYEQMHSICNRIYIARNIVLNPDEILAALEDMDRLMSDRDNQN